MSIEEWLSMTIQWDNIIFTMRDRKFGRNLRQRDCVFYFLIRFT